MYRFIATFLLVATTLPACDEAQLEGGVVDSGLLEEGGASLCRTADSDTAGGCENISSSYTMTNTDTLCWHTIGGGAIQFEVPVNGVCPANYNGPIPVNQHPANQWTLCGLATIMAASPGPCASGCTDGGEQTNTEATATTCKATKVRICKDKTAFEDADRKPVE